MFVALLVPSAGHSLTPAGGTPLRFLVAVLPLGAVPLAELLARRRDSRMLQVGFGLLALLSLQNALAYNSHHYKEAGLLVDWSLSAWKVNLVFPFDSRLAGQFSMANGVLQGAWIVALCALAAWPWLVEKGWTRRMRLATVPQLSAPALALVAVGAFGVLGTSVAAATGHWVKWQYRIPAEKAALGVAQLLDDIGQCAICVSSVRGAVTTGDLLADLERVVPAVAMRPRAGDLKLAYDDWLKMPGRIRAWYVEANGYEPANEDVGHYLFQWREERVPPDEIRRRIFKAAGKPVSGGPAAAPR